MNKKEILQAEREYQKVIRTYGYENWANDNTHESPESIVLMVILKKVLDIENRLNKQEAEE